MKMTESLLLHIVKHIFEKWINVNDAMIYIFFPFKDSILYKQTRLSGRNVQKFAKRCIENNLSYPLPTFLGIVPCFQLPDSCTDQQHGQFKCCCCIVLLFCFCYGISVTSHYCTDSSAWAKELPKTDFLQN
jgi:hypothetical protein